MVTVGDEAESCSTGSAETAGCGSAVLKTAVVAWAGSSDGLVWATGMTRVGDSVKDSLLSAGLAVGLAATVLAAGAVVRGLSVTAVFTSGAAGRGIAARVAMGAAGGCGCA